MVQLSGVRACCGRRRPAVVVKPGQQLFCPFTGQAGICPITQRGGAVKEEQKGAEPKSTKPLLGAATRDDADEAAKMREKGKEAFKDQKFQEALDAYSAAVQLQPRDPLLWLNRSIVNRKLGNWEDAELDAQLAVELDSANVKAHYSRAICLQQLGRLQDALQCCKDGLAKNRGNKALLQLRRSLMQQAREATEEPGSETSSVEESEDNDQQEGDACEQDEGVAAVADDSAACPVSKLSDSDVDFIRDQGKKAAYEWKGRNPSDQERDGLKRSLVDMFKNKYMELKAQTEARKSITSTLKTDQYDQAQKEGLSLQGGHQPMKRPENVFLPPSFRQPLGVLSLEGLSAYGCNNKDRRYLIGVYGDIFDISDRPDKYGPDGPYNELTGRDITWCLFTGIDQPAYCDRCYDLFKAIDLGKDKLAGVCSWLAWYTTEYGDPVARLEPYTRERELPVPPISEVDETCTVM